MPSRSTGPAGLHSTFTEKPPTITPHAPEPPISENDPLDASHRRSLELAMAAAQTAHDNLGKEIVLLDMRELTPVFDYFLVVTGSSRRQLHAISEEIDHCLEDDLGDRRMGIEGYRESRWILLDYGNVVIHLFDQEVRGFYALEELWSGAGRVPLPWDEEEPEEKEPMEEEGE